MTYYELDRLTRTTPPLVTRKQLAEIDRKNAQMLAWMIARASVAKPQVNP